MVFTISIDLHSRIATITWHTARPTLATWREGLAALLRVPGFDPAFGVISDWRDSVDPPDPPFIRAFVAILDRHRTEGTLLGPWVTLVPHEAAALYGMARMTQILSEPLAGRYATFASSDEALAWIKAGHASERGSPGSPSEPPSPPADA